MNEQKLYVWLEGDDDERFFGGILKPTLEKGYDSVKFIQYSQLKKKIAVNMLQAIEKINADYIIVSDIDDYLCITKKKEILNREYRNIDENKVIIVIKEIESWYLAGLSNNACRQLKIPNLGETNSIIKEQFDLMIPKRFNSRIDFMKEILKRFSINIAQRKNLSFYYFIQNFT